MIQTVSFHSVSVLAFLSQSAILCFSRVLAENPTEFYPEMDLNKLPNDEKLQLCKWYFRVGCIFLPFVWAVNAVWFYTEAFRKPPFDEQKEIKRYVVLSACGAAVWVAVLAAWVAVFQTHRAEWGATGDAISFVLPLGRA